MRPPRIINLYGFSVLSQVMEQEILPAFQESWKERTGERVEVVATFAASGRIVDKILQDLPVEVAILASEIDARRLGWSGESYEQQRASLPHGGILSRSPMVILVRAENPQGIQNFEDLGDDGVSLVLADPISSGAGEWTVASVWGCVEGAETLLARIRRNTVEMAPSARLAMTAFRAGTADAVVLYEKQIMGLEKNDGSVVYPRCTAMSEHVVVKITKNITSYEKDVVDALVDFLWSDTAQGLLAEQGFRAANEATWQGQSRFPSIESPRTIESMGGARWLQERLRDFMK